MVLAIVWNWILSVENNENSLTVCTSNSTCIENQSPGKYTYSSDQLLAIRKRVSHNKGLNQLPSNVYKTLTSLNIDCPRKKQRGKRGGRIKVLTLSKKSVTQLIMFKNK